MKKGMNYLVLGFSAVLVGLDQLFKWLAQSYLTGLPGMTLPLWEDVFHLTYLENRGAAFGILDGKKNFLIFLTGAVLLLLIGMVLSNRITRPLMLWSVGLILGGGVGNLLDRIFRRYVIDYLDFRLIHFAVFNFADCCVVVGTILLFVFYVFFAEREKKPEPGGNADEHV